MAILARWAPFEALDNGLDDVVRRAFGEFGSSLLGPRAARGWAPPMDVFVEGGELHVRLEAPGMGIDDFDVEVTNGVLQVRGERRHEEQTQERTYVRRETTIGRFERQIGLPEHIDPASVRASYDAGVLTVTVPLPEKPSSKVKVEIGGSEPKQLQ